MPRTQVTGREVSDKSIFYADIDLTTALTHPTLVISDRLLLVDPTDGLIKTSTVTNLYTLLDARYSITTHSHTLASLSDTTITSVVSGEILKWSGSSWINNTLAEAGIAAASHTHAYDNYVAWTFRVNSETLVNVNSVNSAGTYRGIRMLNGDGISMEGSSGLNNDTIVTITNSAPFPGFGSTSGLAAEGNHTHSGYASSIHTHTLASLSDTAITSVASGEILKWNGSAWINNTLAEAGIQAVGAMSLASLSDTTITSIATGEILKWSGTKWINNTLAEAGIAAASHTHAYDNYGSWQAQAGGNTLDITSDSWLNFVGGTGISLAFDTTYHKITISGTYSHLMCNTVFYAGTTSSQIGGLGMSVEVGVYELEAVLNVYVSAQASGSNYGIYLSTGGTFTGGVSGTLTSTSSKAIEIGAKNTMYGPFLTQASVSGQVIIKGILRTTASGVVWVHHQKVTSGTCYAKTDSFLRVTKIA